MLFSFTFGLTSIGESPYTLNRSIVQHFVYQVYFRHVDVEHADGSVCVETLVEHAPRSYITEQVEIPKTRTRTVCWAEASNLAALLALQFSRPTTL